MTTDKPKWREWWLYSNGDIPKAIIAKLKWCGEGGVHVVDVQALREADLRFSKQSEIITELAAALESIDELAGHQPRCTKPGINYCDAGCDFADIAKQALAKHRGEK